jgi:hypothetical protein
VGTPSVPYGLFWLSPFEGTYATPPTNIVESMPAPIRAGEGGEERARERENEERARYELSWRFLLKFTCLESWARLALT